jgi:hypothetical protein
VAERRRPGHGLARTPPRKPRRWPAPAASGCMNEVGPSEMSCLTCDDVISYFCKVSGTCWNASMSRCLVQRGLTGGTHVTGFRAHAACRLRRRNGTPVRGSRPACSQPGELRIPGGSTRVSPSLRRRVERVYSSVIYD